MTEHPDLNNPKPWLPEIEVGPALARELVEDQFPELGPVRIEALGIGWDNTVYTVHTAEQSLVFRFPRRAIALDLMDTEWKLLDVLVPKLPLSIPRPLYAGVASPAFKWPFAGYTLVPGTTACKADLSHTSRRSLAPLLADFLRQLHGLDTDTLRQLGAPPDCLAKVDIMARLPQTTSRLDQAVELGLIADPGPYQRLIEALPAATPDARPLSFVHGDLYIRHLVVDAQHHLTGVIDWGDAHLGDAATDLSIVYTVLPPDTHELFWSVYGRPDAMTLTLARFRALFHSLALLVYGHDTADPDLLRESLRALGWLAQSAVTSDI